MDESPICGRDILDYKGMKSEQIVIIGGPLDGQTIRLPLAMGVTRTMCIDEQAYKYAGRVGKLRSFKLDCKGKVADAILSAEVKQVFQDATKERGKKSAFLQIRHQETGRAE